MSMPRKRRMGRLYDVMYGNGTRGSHYSSQMFASRSAEQQQTDVEAYAAGGSSGFLTSSMDFSSGSVNINGLASLYNNGSGSFTFATWIKMNGAPGSVPVSMFSFGGADVGVKLLSFGLEADGGGYRAQLLHNSGTLNNVSSSLTALNFSSSAWHMLTYAATRSGANRAYTASLDGSTFVSGTYVANSATYNSASLGMKKSGSTDVGNNMGGRMHQAAFWASSKTTTQVKAIYNSGVSDNWSKHNPQYYWALGVSDGTTISAMSGSVTGTVISGTLVADAP